MKILNYLFAISALLLGILAIVGFYETFHQVEILQVHNEPTPIIGKDLRPGDTLTVQLNYCKLTDDTADVTPEMIGEDVPNRYLPTFISDVKKGCYNSAITVGTIPLSAPAGTYSLRLVIQYQQNVLHRQFITIESEPFDVGAGKVIYLN